MGTVSEQDQLEDEDKNGEEPEEVGLERVVDEFESDDTVDGGEVEGEADEDEHLDIEVGDHEEGLEVQRGEEQPRVRRATHGKKRPLSEDYVSWRSVDLGSSSPRPVSDSEADSKFELYD